MGLHSFLEAPLQIANSSSNYTQTLSNMPLKLVKMKSAYMTLFKKPYDMIVMTPTSVTELFQNGCFLPVDSVVGETIK